MLYHDHPKIALNPNIQGRVHIYRTDFQQRNKQQLSNAPCIIPTSTIWSSTSHYQHLTKKNWTLMCFDTISPHLVPFDKLPNDAHLTTTIHQPSPRPGFPPWRWQCWRFWTTTRNLQKSSVPRRSSNIPKSEGDFENFGFLMGEGLPGLPLGTNPYAKVLL